MKKKNKYNVKTPDISELASSQDYTGLMPTVPRTQEEEDSYSELANTHTGKKKDNI